jgi:hypothetical protein
MGLFNIKSSARLNQLKIWPFYSIYFRLIAYKLIKITQKKLITIEITSDNTLPPNSKKAQTMPNKVPII